MTKQVGNTAPYKKLRAEFMARQGRWGTCARCGELVDMKLSGRTAMGPSVDHIVPTSAGGAWLEVDNLQLVHRSCNSRKGRGEAVGASDRRFRKDGHWLVKPFGRDPASPHMFRACDNPRCAFCLAEGYRTEAADV